MLSSLCAAGVGARQGAPSNALSTAKACASCPLQLQRCRLLPMPAACIEPWGCVLPGACRRRLMPCWTSITPMW